MELIYCQIRLDRHISSMTTDKSCQLFPRYFDQPIKLKDISCSAHSDVDSLTVIGYKGMGG